MPQLAGNLHIHAVRPELQFVSVELRPTVKKENPCTSLRPHLIFCSAVTTRT